MPAIIASAAGLLGLAGLASFDRWEVFGPLATDDECLVGTWIEVSGSRSFTIRDIVIPMTSSGEVRTFRPDGTGSLDYGGESWNPARTPATR